MLVVDTNALLVDTNALLGKMGARRMNRRQLAEAVGVNRNTIAHYLEHPERIPFYAIQKMVIALGMSVDEARDIFFAHKLT